METNDKQINEFLKVVNEQIDNFEETVDEKALDEACNIILEAEKNNGRVHITGIGKPGHVSGYAASLFSSVGTPAYVLDGTEAIHGSSGQVKEGDVVIAISNSGETTELMKTVNCLKENGAQIIALTGNSDSALAKSAKVCLVAKVSEEGDSLNKPPRASILVEMLMLQLLSLLLQNKKNLTKEQYVKWHPGGKIGSSINGGAQL